MYLFIIGAFYVASVYASLMVMSSSNLSSHIRIMEMGYEIKPMCNNSLIENIKYFFHSYGDSFIPIYNVFSTYTKDSESHSETESIRRLYDRARILILDEHGLLVKKSEKSSSSKEEKLIEKKEVQEAVQTNELTNTQVKTLDEMTCYERRDFYRNEYNKLLALRNKAKQEGKSVQVLNSISHQMQPIVDEYNKANRECKIEDHKTEKNIILSSKEEPVKLIRK